jgi:hypothetical protein
MIDGCKFMTKKEEDWNSCERLGQVRPKTCVSCVFNKKNKAERKKASKYYHV